MIFDRELKWVEVMAGDRVEKSEMTEKDPKPMPKEDLVSVQIVINPEEVTYIGSHLLPQDRTRLTELLKENQGRLWIFMHRVRKVSSCLMYTPGGGII